MLDWAGIAIIVAVQLATTYCAARRIDALTASVSDLCDRLGAICERVSRIEGVMLGRGGISAD